MSHFLFYRILSVVLLPIAALLGIMTLCMLLMALTNPAILLPLFMFASVVIYSISSFIFLQKGINKSEACKHSLRDWIRVNAFVSIGFSVICFIQSVGLLNNPIVLNDLIIQTMSRQPDLSNDSQVIIVKAMKGTLYFMLIFSAILLIHIIYTFRMLKIHKHLFKE